MMQPPCHDECPMLTTHFLETNKGLKSLLFKIGYLFLLGGRYPFYSVKTIALCGNDSLLAEVTKNGHGMPCPYTDVQLIIFKTRSEERRVGKECRSRWS